MDVTEFRRGEYLITTDQSKLKLASIHDFLSRSSYWAQGRSYAAVEKSVKNSLCFGMFVDHVQIGFARVVTDYTTFAWLCDVFVADKHRGRGLSKWLVECVVAHPDLANISRFLLATRDAHELYRRYGEFETLANPEWWMARKLR